MKKLIRVFRFESDVLIIDTVGSDFVIKCIPAEFSYSVVEVRKGIPYIPRLFFFHPSLRKSISVWIKKQSFNVCYC